MDTVRYRKGKRNISGLSDNYYARVVKDDTYRIPNFVGFSAILILILSLKGFNIINNLLPPILTLEDEFNNPEKFIGQRAESFLKRLTDIGTRVVGSYENEVLTVDLLQREISFIVQQAEKIHKIETDVQKPTGSYYLTLKPHNFRNYYANIQNIVVKFSSNHSSSNSVLLNCHYDTVPESPGASDNGLNCAVLLEILTKFSKLKAPLHNTVIFLFNGAEENPLQASHGFITQHKWSKDIRVLINLDSAGAGGKELLFQTPSTVPWLVKTYARSVPRPSGGVHAEDLFLSGIIPSDTDYRIFRDFGQVPGLDIAHAENGYVYHTKFDKMRFIPPGTFQYTGDNILALTRALAEAPELVDLLKANSDWRVVYFDVLNLFMIVYSELSAFILNVATTIFSIFTIRRTFQFLSDSDRLWLDISLSTAKQLFSWFLSGAFILVIGKLLDAYNGNLSWYRHHWFVVPLYGFPFILASAFLPFLDRYYKKKERPEETAIKYVNGNQLIWTIVLIAGTYHQVRSSFMVMMLVLFSSIGSIIGTFSKRNFSGKKYIFWIVISSSLAILFMLQQAVKIYTILIPMTARMGPHMEPELLIGGLATVFGIFSVSHLIPLTVVLEKPSFFFKCLAGLHLALLAAILFTPVGFPYSGNLGYPMTQRFYLLHCERTFHDSKGNVRKSDSGIFVQAMDRNNIHYVSKVIPALESARSASGECISELNCGVPVYTTRFINPAPFGFWVPASAPLIHHPTNLEVTAQTPVDIRTRRISFVITGPDHISIMMSPRIGVRLVKWSIDNQKPIEGGKWLDRDVYIVYYSHGLMGGTLEFDLDLEVNPETTVSDSVLDIAIVGHYMHDKNTRSEEFKKLIGQFPDWAHVTPWTTTYKSWVI